MSEEGVLEALTEQSALLEWWKTDVGKEYGRAFAQSMYEKREPWAYPRAEQWPYLVPDIMRDMLKNAGTYYVERDITEIIEAIAGSMPPERFLITDLPEPSGFVLLGKPLMTEDVHAKTMGNRAFAWRLRAIPDGVSRRLPEGSAALEVSYYAHNDDWDDYRPNGTYEDWREQLGTTLLLNYCSFWPLGVPYWELKEGYSERQILTYTFVKAFFRLIEQEVLVRHPHKGPRYAARRLGRLQDRPVHKPEVQVIKLRRVARPGREDDDQGWAPVEWSHRWLVRGHWRNQFLPSSGTHRLTWINPYVKGPEDKPFRQTRKVFDVSR